MGGRATGTGDRRGGGGLTRRTVAVCVLLSAVIGTAFILLVLAIDILRESESRANHAMEALVAANHLERVTTDIETTEQDFVITGAPQFLQPWRRAQTEFTQQPAALERLAGAGDGSQGYRARQIRAAGESYIREYSVPLVATAQHNPASARSVSVTEEGKRLVEVDVSVADEVLRLLIQDDGTGGADPSRGSGLIGLSDRVEAAGGKIEITSPPGGGTSLLVTIPLEQALDSAQPDQAPRFPSVDSRAITTVSGRGGG
jgi:CHASE3 domain sensor protein